MIGAIARATNIISEEAARNAIKDSVPPGTEDKNLAAFEAGMAIFD